MERVTITQVERTFERFCEVMGTETASQAYRAGRPIRGTYSLHVQRLEGYRIRVERNLSESGAVTCPFGYTVRACREMDGVLRFAIQMEQERVEIARERASALAGEEGDVDRRNREMHERSVAERAESA